MKASLDIGSVISQFTASESEAQIQNPQAPVLSPSPQGKSKSQIIWAESDSCSTVQSELCAQTSTATPTKLLQKFITKRNSDSKALIPNHRLHQPQVDVKLSSDEEKCKTGVKSKKKLSTAPPRLSEKLPHRATSSDIESRVKQLFSSPPLSCKFYAKTVSIIIVHWWCFIIYKAFGYTVATMA